MRVLVEQTRARAEHFTHHEDGPGDVPYIPSAPEVVEAMLKLGGVKQSDIVYDLRCGDGRIVIMAAQKFDAHAVGVEISPERVRKAEEKARIAGVSGRVLFTETDLFSADIRDATVITLYLLAELNLQLRPKLLREPKPGARIDSHAFDMADWKPEREEVIHGQNVYLWTVSK